MFFKVITLKYLFQLQSTQKIRVILISSVTPSPSSAGQVLLYRHLVNQPGIDLHVLQTEPSKPGMRRLLRRLLGRLAKIKLLRSFCQDIMVFWRGGWIDAELPPPAAPKSPTVVMTVAHEEACCAAARYARRYDLPLVTFFHDWWPDLAQIHAPFRPMLERSFRQLYQESSLALCVSECMKQELGPHENSKVLLPIPAKCELPKSSVDRDLSAPFRVLYAGNLAEYGPMLMDALEVLKDNANIRLEVRGNSAHWPEPIRVELSDRGLLLPFASGGQFSKWLETADAFLVPQSFKENDKRLMQTNFPSKLPEFAQYGRPLILWGPAQASGPQWASNTGQGLVVDEENPDQLRIALERLCNDRDQQKRLSRAACDAAGEYFDPKRIQSGFMRWLREISADAFVILMVFVSTS